MTKPNNQTTKSSNLTVARQNFIVSETQRVSKLYSTKHKAGFPTRDSFTTWFIQQMQSQDFQCYYCETSIFLIRGLIDTEKLLARKTGYGYRGRILEIDKKRNSSGYNMNNCVLSCYYCNNDKSYTLDSDVYKEYFGPSRKRFFEFLNRS